MFYVLSSLIIIFMNYVSYRGLFADAALKPLAAHKRALGLFFLTLAVGGVALAFSLRFNFLGPSLRIACSGSIRHIQYERCGYGGSDGRIQRLME